MRLAFILNERIHVPNKAREQIVINQLKDDMKNEKNITIGATRFLLQVGAMKLRIGAQMRMQPGGVYNL